MAFVWWAFLWVLFLLTMYILYDPEDWGLGFIWMGGVVALFVGIFLFKSKMKDNSTS